MYSVWQCYREAWNCSSGNHLWSARGSLTDHFTPMSMQSVPCGGLTTGPQLDINDGSTFLDLTVTPFFFSLTVSKLPFESPEVTFGSMAVVVLQHI